MLVLIFTQSSLLSRSFVLFFYIYGSIPFALIFTYLASGEIIHKIGTRNVGVANAFWGGGLAAGFSTVIGETSKALLPLIEKKIVLEPEACKLSIIKREN